MDTPGYTLLGVSDTSTTFFSGTFVADPGKILRDLETSTAIIMGLEKKNCSEKFGAFPEGFYGVKGEG